MKNFIKTIRINYLERKIQILDSKYKNALDYADLYIEKSKLYPFNLELKETYLYRSEAYLHAADGYIDERQSLKQKLKKLKA